MNVDSVRVDSASTSRVEKRETETTEAVAPTGEATLVKESTSDELLNYISSYKALYGEYPSVITLPPGSKLKPRTLYLFDDFLLSVHEMTHYDIISHTSWNRAVVSALPPVRIKLMAAVEEAPRDADDALRKGYGEAVGADREAVSAIGAIQRAR